MIGKIKFPTQAMFHAFADAMKSMGYPENPASLICNQRELSVGFTFNQPRTAWQPHKDPARKTTYADVRAVNRVRLFPFFRVPRR
jgi:hypothetical protein